VTQPKILRVLQEGDFERLGGTRTQHVDVRVVAATNQDLAALVRERRFREDLYYRLNVITIVAPPLRDRQGDIPLLAQHFVRLYAAKNNRKLEGLSDDAIRCLEAHPWPGNVRELENVIERAVILARGPVIDAKDLPDTIAANLSVLLVRPEPAAAADDAYFKVRVGTPLAEVEARLLEETLRLTGNNKAEAARLLGIDPKTVFRKLKREAEEAAGDGREDHRDPPA
jgi:two-component system response regulator HydG